MLAIILLTIILLLIIIWKFSKSKEHFGGSGALTQLNSTRYCDTIEYPDGWYIGKYPYYHYIFNRYKSDPRLLF